MKIKTFSLRLSHDHQQADEDAINSFMTAVSVKKTATELITGKLNTWSIIVFYEDDADSSRTIKKTITNEVELDSSEKTLFDILKRWRQEKAAELNIPVFLVCHNAELMAIAKFRPNSLEALSTIKGFGGQKMAKFGEEILAVLNAVQ